MINTLLFDIDNTLILFNETDFFQTYLPAITAHFSDLMPEALFQERIVSASQLLLNNRGRKTNADFFLDAFSKGYEKNRTVFWRRFIDFYKTHFDQFQILIEPIKGTRAMLLKLYKMNLKLVIASHPIWPEEVQKKRLLWAGLDEIPFNHITHIENTTYCKPQLEYYQEICDTIGERPHNCLMVGNDPVNDMVSKKIGLLTYLTTDAENVDDRLPLSSQLRKKLPLNTPKPDFTGPLMKVFQTVETLCNKKVR
jgi:FMN phosphatase YigB (HAD superfamily)